jgi:alpha-1,2-mannosyltransferase
MSETPHPWRFERYEKVALLTVLASLVVFGLHIEWRTALRRTLCFTDLGVYTRAAWAVRTGENLYTISDSNGLHYNYPPAFAILFTPLGMAPWGYDIASDKQTHGLQRDNLRFFCIVWIWYAINVVLEFLSVHLLACVLEGRKWTTGPPDEAARRRRWWALRSIPLLACLGSVDMDLSRGQTDLVILAGISVALYLAAQNREISAGIVLVLPAAIKLFPIVLLAYPVWRRRGRMILGYILGLSLFFVVLPIATLGLDRSVALYRTWTDVLVRPALGQANEPSRAQELSMTTMDNQSLLAVIHNWQHYNLPRGQRPFEASTSARLAAYLVSALTIFGMGILSVRRRDKLDCFKQSSLNGGRKPQRSDLVIVGLLIGWSFMLAPVVRNSYFLLLLPLLAALVDCKLPHLISDFRRLELPWVVLVFMVTDMLVRVPGLGSWLRDLGIPLLTVTWLMAAGASMLLGELAGQLSDYSQIQVEH